MNYVGIDHPRQCTLMTMMGQDDSYSALER